MGFDIWLRMTIVSFLTGVLVAVPGFIFTLIFDGFLHGLGWAAIILGVGIFMLVSGLLWVAFLLAACAAYAFSPAIGMVAAIVFGVLAIFAYYGRIAMIEDVLAKGG